MPRHLRGCGLREVAQRQQWGGNEATQKRAAALDPRANGETYPPRSLSQARARTMRSSSAVTPKIRMQA